MLAEFEKKGVIQKSNSPYSSRCIMVPKKPGKNGEVRFRMVQTLVELSNKSVIQNFTLRSPRDQLADVPPEACVFSGTDLKAD